MSKPFTSLGYDFVRIGKTFSEDELAELHSCCILSDGGVYYFLRNRAISFRVYGSLVFLQICPPKLLRGENVKLASPIEVSKAIMKVRRETSFDSSNGYVPEIHFTFTLETPLPFVQYRSLFRAPQHYTHRMQADGDYFNSERITTVFYDKAKECNGNLPKDVQFQTLTPELFRSEIRMLKPKQVLKCAGCWDNSKLSFLAEDLASDLTFLGLVQYANKHILRFLKPVRTTSPFTTIKSEQDFFRYKCENKEFVNYILNSDRYTNELRRKAIRYQAEAAKREIYKYLRTHLTDATNKLLCNKIISPLVIKTVAA